MFNNDHLRECISSIKCVLLYFESSLVDTRCLSLISYCGFFYLLKGFNKKAVNTLWNMKRSSGWGRGGDSLLYNTHFHLENYVYSYFAVLYRYLSIGEASLPIDITH